jgi:hypothetical protein
MKLFATLMGRRPVSNRAAMRCFDVVAVQHKTGGGTNRKELVYHAMTGWAFGAGTA